MYLDDVIPESLNLESNPAPDQTRDDILDSPVLPAFASKKIIPTAYDILFHHCSVLVIHQNCGLRIERE
jgi:hypothetical protein